MEGSPITTATSHVLTVVKKGIWEDRYIISDDEGNELCTVVTGVLPRKGTLSGELAEFDFRREKMFAKTLLLRRGDEVIARAIKPKLFQDYMELEYGNMEFTLGRERGIKLHVTVRWDGEEIGEIRASRTKVHAEIHLPDTLPLHLKVFMFWLTQILWDRYAWL